MQTEIVTVVGGEPQPSCLPLTWAQANMWDAIWGAGTEADNLIVRRTIVPEQTIRVADVLRAVAAVGGRYDIIRTTFRHRDQQQRIHRSVDLTVTLADVTDDPADDGDRLAASLCAAPFAHEVEPPLRIGVLRSGSRVVSIALALSHLAFDGRASWLLRDVFAAELAGRSVDRDSPPAQTGWLVAQEASPRQIERSNGVIGRWKKAMAALPAGRGIAPPTFGPYTLVNLRSAAVTLAAQQVAGRTGTGSSSVLLAALALALRDILPNPPAAFQMISGNRHYPNLSDFIGITAQNGLFVIPPTIAGTDFGDYLRQTHQAASWAYLSARYDTAQLRDYVFRGQERGEVPDLSFFFNDVRGGTAPPTAEQRLADLRAIRDRETATPTVVGQRAVQDCTVFLHVLPAGRECTLLLISDDRLVEPAASVAILDRIRDIVVSAALDSNVALPA